MILACSSRLIFLSRFYDVQGGSITIDGYDIRSLDPTWLRGRAIGFINQEPILFATSIMENIRYGKPSATDEEVIHFYLHRFHFIIDLVDSIGWQWSRKNGF